MAKDTNILEEAIIQMKNLEEAVAENAKGILASTMKQEIKDLVKESLNEQDDEDEEIDDVDTDVADVEFPDDEEDFEDEEDETEFDTDEDEIDFEDETMDFEDGDDEEVLDLRHLDQSGMSPEESSEVLLKVFKAMGPNDEIEVEKDSAGYIHLSDDNTDSEYIIMDESYSMDEEDMMDGTYMDENYMDEEDMMMDETYMDEEDMMMDETYMDEMYMDEEDDDNYEKTISIFDELDETIYEVEMDEEFMEESLYESKKTMKPKGVTKGSGPKFKYSPKPNMDGGFDEDMKEGDKMMGTGSAKKVKLYKSDSPSLHGEFKESKHKMNSNGKMEKKEVMAKKGEQKEASRTLGNGKYWGREGLPKPKAAPRHIRKESIESQEMEVLREKNEEYRKALNIFRDKLNEVAVFNSNLAYATRLFTEHSTSKQEKINILKRFDDVETIKESKTLYKIIKDELSVSKPNQVNESIERTINKVPTTGSAINLIESKTYENPQFMRMKDLMSKLK